MNPRVGSALQHTRTAAEEETVEVVGNHVDGTQAGCGRLVSKVNP
jgi:hypothetical protein